MANKASALEELIGKNQASQAAPASTLGALPTNAGPSFTDGYQRSSDTGMMEIKNIIPDPEQVRKHIDEVAIEEMASSIGKYGILQPLVIRWKQDIGKHIIIAGERRYRGAIKAGLKVVPCIFRKTDEMTEGEIVRQMLTENCLREDFSVVEQANGFKSAMELDGFSQAQLAESLGINKSRISKALKILELDGEIQSKVQSGKIDSEIAYGVAAKEKDPKKQVALVEEIEARGFTRSEASNYIAETTKKGVTKAKNPNTRNRGLKRRYNLPSKAVFTLAWPKVKMTKAEELAAAEELVSFLKGEIEAPDSTKKKGKDASVKG